jgi:hypothetical protein
MSKIFDDFSRTRALLPEPRETLTGTKDLTVYRIGFKCYTSAPLTNCSSELSRSSKFLVEILVIWLSFRVPLAAAFHSRH